MAAQAGVSISTVSKALNDIDVVTPTTKQRVLEAAKKLNYVPNMMGKQLKSGQTKIIGFYTRSIEAPYFSSIADVIARFDKEVGLGSYWFVLDDNYAIEMGQKPATSIRQMVEWAADKVAPRFETEDMNPTTGSEGRNLTQLNIARVQALAAYIQAPTAEEGRQIWEDYLASRENYGYSQILEYQNAKIAENLQKLSAE